MSEQTSIADLKADLAYHERKAENIRRQLGIVDRPHDAGPQGHGSPDLSAGLADRELAMPGPDKPDADLGELARPFAASWFPGRPVDQERCVGAIRDFVLSSTFSRWWNAQMPCWQCQGLGLYVPASDTTAEPVRCPACKGVGR